MTSEQREILNELRRATSWQQACRISDRLDAMGSPCEYSLTPDAAGGVRVALPAAVVALLDSDGTRSPVVVEADAAPEAGVWPPRGAFLG